MYLMNDPQSPNRTRLQELLAIPERQRTDAEWDELNELEIVAASTNRHGAPNPQQHARGSGPMQSGSGQPQHHRHGGQQQGPGGGGGQNRGQGKKKFHHRPKRNNNNNNNNGR
jgi:hypothetical protein